MKEVDVRFVEPGQISGETQGAFTGRGKIQPHQEAFKDRLGVARMLIYHENRTALAGDHTLDRAADASPYRRGAAFIAGVGMRPHDDQIGRQQGGLAIDFFPGDPRGNSDFARR